MSEFNEKSISCYTMSLEGYRKVCLDVFSAAGMHQACAEAVTDNLLFADLRGISSHGISRLKLYTDYADSGFFNVRGEPEVISDLGSIIHIDGHHAFGAYTGSYAMALTIEKSKKTGVALCVVNNSTHFGAAAYYSMMALDQDCIGVALSNAVPMVAHHAARETHIGTNPISITFPTKRNWPYVLDMASSVVAGGKIVNCEREKKPIPLGWACDKEGNPTSDPKAAMAGFYLPIGGYKGSGLAIAIDVLCGILGGGRFGRQIVKGSQVKDADLKHGPGISHLFASIDISFFNDPDAFKADLDTFIDELRSAPVAPGYEQILIAGEPEFLIAEKLKTEGIPIEEGSYRQLKDICARYNLSVGPDDFLIDA